MNAVEINVAKGEMAHYEQFLLLSQLFQKSFAAEASVSVYMWKRVKVVCCRSFLCGSSLIWVHLHGTCNYISAGKHKDGILLFHNGLIFVIKPFKPPYPHTANLQQTTLKIFGQKYGKPLKKENVITEKELKTLWQKVKLLLW